ncbi:hypothetical protein PVK06_040355 [Gossypium arboreum]|uniref:GRF-type domain-containing protein n=1 Tax=Gossypium arboreum TaxID=29729 RepID=A0ABR0N588_GOSAR|nr:hypothetical protein PVK06_040355 [Gossypium arboreum]
MEKLPYVKLVSSLQREFVYDKEKRRCFCNKLAPRETSWNGFNPDRRYYGCLDFRVGGCKFFKWYDDKLCNRANEVIHELRDSKRKLAKENTRLRKQIMKCGSGEMSENGSVQNVRKDNQTKEVNHDVVDNIEINTKINNLKQKSKSLKKEKEFYKKMFICSVLLILFVTLFRHVII